MTSEQLFYDKKTGFDRLTEADRQGIQTYAEGYKTFLDEAKTERDAVKEIARMAEAKGFRAWTRDDTLKTGDRIYRINRHKGIMLAVIGEKSLAEGVRLTAAHLDAPRVDIRTVPLYEDNGMAFFKTHYYGGIKKYQWVAMPLAMHGVVAKKDGTLVNIVIGEDPSDPVIGISDLLPHLSRDQMSKKGSVVIEGEELNIIIGSKPLNDEEKEPVKAAVLALLKEKYDIEEEDFLSAELEVVPAGAARDFGLDRSMILGYGHDDRVCAYASVNAILSIDETPEYTCCCLLADKEEIGSVGATGMHGKYFENAVAELVNSTGEYSDLLVRRALTACRMLSCDVSAGYDPNFAGVFERKNAAYLGRGVCFNKYTGSGGKGGSNDANAEYMGKLRRLMDDANVNFQTAELGKVDQGGGGTIAYICANYGMEVIDSGVAVLSMHAPWEIISKADLYEAVKAYHAFMLKA